MSVRGELTVVVRCRHDDTQADPDSQITQRPYHILFVEAHDPLPFWLTAGSMTPRLAAGAPLSALFAGNARTARRRRRHADCPGALDGALGSVRLSGPGYSMTRFDYDLFVIGAGSGGIPASR